MFKYHVFALLLGTILDFVFGRLYSLWNPFDSIKSWIKFLDRALLGDEIILLEEPKRKNLGFWLIVLSVLPVFAVVTFFSMLCYEICPAIGILFEAFASYLCIEANNIFYKAREVMKDYYGHSILSMMQSAALFTGSNYENSTEEDVTKDVITCVANETSDSVISPIFVMFLFGPVGGFLYRTIDLLDQQVGHLNERYKSFGYYTAKLNQIIDYIPGRFSGVMVVMASKYTFGDFNYKNAKYINLRDRCKAISAFSGALGISLKKNTIGDDDKIASPKDIRVATNLLRNTFVILQIILVILLLFF